MLTKEKTYDILMMSPEGLQRGGIKWLTNSLEEKSGKSIRQIWKWQKKWGGPNRN